MLCALQLHTLRCRSFAHCILPFVPPVRFAVAGADVPKTSWRAASFSSTALLAQEKSVWGQLIRAV